MDSLHSPSVIPSPVAWYQMPSFSMVVDDVQARDETLLTLLHTLAQQTPNNDFLIEDAGTHLSYRQFYILASRLFPSRLLHLWPDLSSPRTRKVLLFSPNNSLFPLTLWALWFMSFTVVPISVKSEQSLWEAMVDHASPDALVISRSLKDVAAQHLAQRANVNVAYLEDIIPVQFTLQTSTTRQSDFIPSLLKWLSHAMGTEHGPDLELGDPLHVDSNLPVVSLFTSSAVDASTLKSVTYAHSMIVQSTSNLIEVLGGSSYCNRPVRHLGWLSLSHCFEFCISFLGIVLRTGGSYIFFDREVSSPSASLSNALHIQLLEAIQYHRTVDSICLVPAIFADMIKDLDRAGLENLKAMRSIGVGGAPTPEDVFRWTVEQGINFFDCSGATEAAGTICIRRATVQSMSDYGLQVVPGLEGFLEKESLEDDYGELVIRGAFLPSGYDNKESSSFLRDSGTRKIIYRTGDLYEQHVELKRSQTASSYLKGEDLPIHKNCQPALAGLRYLGRVDDLVILASGVKIDALTLERRINAHPCIMRSAVISDMRRETPVVLLQLTVEAAGLHAPRRDEEVVRFVLELNRSLSFDKRIRPENVVIVKDLPITTKLTLNRKKVKKIWAESNGKWPVTRNCIDASPRNTYHLDDQLLVRSETRKTIEILLSDIFDIPVDHFSRQCVHFSEIPLTSLSSVQLASALESHFAIKLSASQLYSLRSVDDICELIIRSDQTGFNGPYERDSSLSDTIRVPNSAEPTDSSLAITGVACRYPGKLASLNDLWGALLDPQTYAKKVRKTATTMRWKAEAVRQSDIPPIAWLEDENFENLQAFRDFFRLSPSDAESMSPNARLLLQMGYQAIEDAGIAPSSLSGQTWGVFSSVNNSGWRERRSTELNLHAYSASLLGSADDAVGARLSYFLNLTGPAVEIKTACSSSAVAIHQACSSIMNGDCDGAIVISSTTHFHPSGPMFRSQAGIASKSGHCATFSSDADGFFPGEGAAAIVIQKAVDVHCSPYARIKASHIAQDGHSHGFFAPNPTAQAALISRTINKAGCTEDDIDLIEAHGTGTQLGDAVEMQALDNIFLGKRTKPLFIGAVKAVLGHTEECAGLSSVLKSILCLQNNVIPAQPNLLRPNPQIDLARPKFCISRHIVAFPRNGRPRRIGVSSFGLTGTLAHIILEDFDDGQVSKPSRRDSTPKLFLLSANDSGSYESLVTRYLDFALSHHALESEVEDICMTTQIGRDHFPLRRAFTVADHHSWITSLSKELGDPKPRSCLKSGNIRLGLWFGLPFANTSFDIPDFPVFDQERSLVAKGNWDRCYSSFAQQLIIANTLKSLGCQIEAVGGEGMAEWVAGVVAGVLPIESVFQKTVGPGCLESYLLRGSGEIIPELLTQWLPSELALRGCYTNDLYALDGTANAVKEFSQLGEVNLTHYSSFPHAEPPRGSQTVPHQTSTFISGHLGEVVDRDTLQNGAYWARVTKEFFDSSRGIEELEAHCDLVLHIGGPASSVDRETYVHYGAGNIENLLGVLYERGCNIEWSRFGTGGRRVHLPVYQWTR